MLTLGEYSEATKRMYLSELRHLFTYYLDTRPSQFTENMAWAYLLYLSKTLKSSKVKIKMATQSFSFFFKHVLRKEYHSPKVLYTSHEHKLPAVMSADEVRKIIIGTKNIKHRTLLSLAYSTGMRLQEICNLKIDHIDSNQMVIKIIAGKGRKDRIVPLSYPILSILRIYFLQYRPQIYLFNGSKTGCKYSARMAQHILSKTLSDHGLQRKDYSFHTLRHSFATHLYDSGTDLLTIQQLMGHQHISQTIQYLHLSTKRLANIVNPFDLLLDQPAIEQPKNRTW